MWSISVHKRVLTHMLSNKKYKPVKHALTQAYIINHKLCRFCDNNHGAVKNSDKIQTYVLTPWSRVLLEKLTGSAASQEIPRIFGT